MEFTIHNVNDWFDTKKDYKIIINNLEDLIELQKKCNSVLTIDFEDKIIQIN